jgi:Uncharacterized protein conserved in bacteria (DUF2330)
MVRTFSKNRRVFIGLIICLCLFAWCTLLTTANATDNIISPTGTKVELDKLNAVIIHDGKQTETLILRLDYKVKDGKPQNFGWIIPTPTKPKVKAVSNNIFVQLKNLTVPKTNYVDDIFGRKLETKPDKTPVQTTRVGAYDIAVISAYEQQTIRDWAGKNNFNYINLYSQPFREYLAEGWYFTMVRLQPDRGELPQSGYSVPIALTFEAFSPMIPWRMMGDATNARSDGIEYDTNVYILSPVHKMTNQHARMELTTSYAERLPEETSRDIVRGLEMVAYQSYYVTHFSGSVPGWVMQDSDMKFMQAGDISEVNNGKLQGGDWITAFLVTALYGPLATLGTFWVLFTATTSGVIIGGIIIGIIYLFYKPLKSRRLITFILMTLLFLLSTGITISVVFAGTPVWVLFSIIPPVIVWLWTGKRAFVDEEGRQLFANQNPS